MSFLIVILLIFFSITTICYSLHYGITPMPSNRKARKALFELLPMEVKGTILELGAGFGHLALPLAKRYPNLIVAYEISPLPYLILKMLKLILRLHNLKVLRQDFFKSSFRESGLCVCYLYPAGMQKLKRKFQEELKEGALIVSNTFTIGHWKALQEVDTLDLYNSKIFLYEKPS